MYNNEGEEILKLQKEEPYSFWEAYEFKISPNGKYLGIRTGRDTHNETKNAIIFYDLEKGNSWEYLGDWDIGELSNEGTTRLMPFSGKEKSKVIDLKEYLEGK